MPLSTDDLDYIRHAYREGVRRGAALAGLGEAVEGAVGFSVAHVEKYSPDQTAYATRKLIAARPVSADPRRIRLISSDFQRYFPRGGEEGEAVAAGNIFVAVGLTNLFSLWLGLTGTAVNKLSGTGSVCGVGTGTAYANTGGTADTALTSDNGASAWYQAFDNAASLATTSTPGVLVGTMTAGSANANFAWNEWCWATGAGAITPGTYLSSGVFATASSAAMMNHKVNVNLGTKASGSSWVFSTTFTIS